MFYFIPKSVRFFTRLDLPRTIHNMKYEYRGKAIVYAFRCTITNMVYVGSTLAPGRRIDNHLVTGLYSNFNLQGAIQLHGIKNFTAYILSSTLKGGYLVLYCIVLYIQGIPTHLWGGERVVVFPAGLTHKEQRIYLRGVEQSHIDLFPSIQLYNEINSSNVS